MTRDDIATMIAGVGLPFACDHFTKDDAPAGPPFICFLYTDSDDFLADDSNFQRITGLAVELYTAAPDFDKEAAVEAALTGAGLVYSRGGPEYIEAERMYQTTWETSVLLTEAEEPVVPDPPAVPDPSDPSTLYNGQTVDGDGWIVNSTGDEMIAVLKLPAENPAEYAGLSYRLAYKAKYMATSAEITWTADDGGGEVTTIEERQLDSGDYTYAEGVISVDTLVTLPNNAHLAGYVWKVWTDGVKDISLTPADEQ